MVEGKRGKGFVWSLKVWLSLCEKGETRGGGLGGVLLTGKEETITYRGTVRHFWNWG